MGDFKSQIATLLDAGGRGKCVKGNHTSPTKDQNGETIGDLNHSIGKPPLDHSIIRHCSSNL